MAVKIFNHYSVDVSKQIIDTNLQSNYNTIIPTISYIE